MKKHSAFVLLTLCGSTTHASDQTQPALAASTELSERYITVCEEIQDGSGMQRTVDQHLSKKDVEALLTRSLESECTLKDLGNKPFTADPHCRISRDLRAILKKPVFSDPCQTVYATFTYPIVVHRFMKPDANSWKPTTQENITKEELEQLLSAGLEAPCKIVIDLPAQSNTTYLRNFLNNLKNHPEKICDECPTLKEKLCGSEADADAFIEKMVAAELEGANAPEEEETAQKSDSDSDDFFYLFN